MDNEGEKHRDGTDINSIDEAERAETEQHIGLSQEVRKHSSASSLTSEVGSDPDSIPDAEVFDSEHVNKTLDDNEKEKESFVAPERTFRKSPADGFRSTLFSAALSRPNTSDKEKQSRPGSADNAELETKSRRRSSQNSMPQILAFKRESDAESRPSTATSSSTVAVEQSEMRIDQVETDDMENDSKEVFHFQGMGAEQLVYEGEVERMIISREGFEQVEVVSQCCQTEWSWLQDMKLIQWKMGSKPDWAENRANSRQSTKSAGPAEDVLSSPVRTRRKKKYVSTTPTRQVTEARGGRRASSRQSDARKYSTQHKPQSERGSPSLRSRSKASVMYKSSASGVSSLPQTPKGDQDMFFRAPTVEPSSSSSSDNEYDYEVQQESLLPSIGPPTILQYNKESENPPLGNDEPSNLLDANSEGLMASVFSGPCMFCAEEILPFPTMQEVETIPPEQLYCCPKYEEFLKAELAHRGSDAAFVRDEMIDIKPHPPYGTKAARKAAKERAAERAREREMERQKAAGVNQTNFYALTRQMKTITYSLASTKCMDEGWTVRPASPSNVSEQEFQDPFVIEINPQQLRRQTFLERFYDDGRRFLLVLPDGSGCCYYPSGNVAVVISLTEQGKFAYLVYELLKTCVRYLSLKTSPETLIDSDEFDQGHPGMLAVFEPSGYGTCYFKGGTVRMALNPFGGVLLDSQGAKKKKWLWHNLKTHVHAPPFQPITFSLSRHLSIRCLAQNKIVLTFNHHRYTARFNVGAKLKAVAKITPPIVRDQYDTHLAEMKHLINILIDRSQTSMRFPHHPRPDKLPLPLRLQKAKESSKKRVQNLLPLRQSDTPSVIVN